MRQAQDILRSEAISVLLSDIEMPKGSGLRLVEWVREQKFDIIPIFFTSHAVFDYAKQALSLGVTEYLLKPVEKDALNATLAKAVELAKPFLTRKSPDIISQIKQYIEENLERGWTRNELAEAIHFHPDYLSHFFKEKTGMSLSDYTMKIRIEHAKNLLLTTEMPVSEIALSCGYGSFAYFSKIFKRFEGIAPTEYRQKRWAKK